MRSSRDERTTIGRRSGPSLLTLFILCALGAASCLGPVGEGTGERPGGGVTRERADSLLHLYAEARNTADLDLLDDVYAPDVLVHDASAPGPIQGLEALKTFYEASHLGFPDLRIRWDDVLVDGDQIASRWTFEGTNTGVLRGMPPTGKHVTFSGVAIDRVDDGRIVEEWVYFNVLDLLEQLGVASPPATPAAGG
jgi:steroid delta-isomerase-like uncharacterized protein